MNVEVKGNAKTKIFSSWIGLVDWIGDEMSQLKLIEYQTMHHVGHPSMCMAYLCKGMYKASYQKR